MVLSWKDWRAKCLRSRASQNLFTPSGVPWPSLLCDPWPVNQLSTPNPLRFMPASSSVALCLDAVTFILIISDLVLNRSGGRLCAPPTDEAGMPKPVMASHGPRVSPTMCWMIYLTGHTQLLGSTYSVYVFLHLVTHAQRSCIGPCANTLIDYFSDNFQMILICWRMLAGHCVQSILH